MFDLMNRRRNQDYFDVFFSDVADTFEGKFMKVDVKETQGAYILECEVPGVRKDDIKLVVNDDVLTINVKREEQTDTTNEKYLRKERRFGSWSRSFTIRDIDEDTVNAHYEDGVLYVTLPKVTMTGQDRTRMITIE